MEIPTDWLTVSNLILSCFIAFHLACEFLHYIYSFLMDRKGNKVINDNKKLLKELVERIEQLEILFNGKYKKEN